MELKTLPERIQAATNHLTDPDSPTSLVNLLPDGFYRIMNNALAGADPNAVDLMYDEKLLKKYLKSVYSYEPTVNEHRLRYMFWLEYEAAIHEGRKMKIASMHSILCDERTFYKLMMTNAHNRIVFFLSRPENYENTLKEMLFYGMSRLRNILDLEDMDKKGNPNVKLLELKMKVTAMVDMRLNGTPTQKVHQITQTFTNKNREEVKEMIAKGDMAAIKKRIENLEYERKKLEGRAVEREEVVLEAVPVKVTNE